MLKKEDGIQILASQKSMEKFYSFEQTNPPQIFKLHLCRFQNKGPHIEVSDRRNDLHSAEEVSSCMIAHDFQGQVDKLAEMQKNDDRPPNQEKLDQYKKIPHYSVQQIFQCTG